MAHLRARYRQKNGKKILSGYAVEFYDPDRYPTRKYVTLRTKDRRVAQRRLVELEKKFSLRTWDPWLDSTPREDIFLAEAVERYLKARSDRRPKTQRADESLLGLLREAVGPGFLLAHIEPRHIERLIGRDNLSSSTRATYHTRLKTFFAWCMDEGVCKHNPLEKIKKPKLHRKEKQFLTQEQYAMLLRCIEADVILKREQPEKHTNLKNGEIVWLIDVIKVAVGTGLRVSELCAMRWSWINLDMGIVTVRSNNGFITKSGHERMIPVRGEALDVLRCLHNQRNTEQDCCVFTGTGGDPLNATYVSKRFKKYVRLARLPETLSFHSLRHTFISWLIMDGVPVPVVQRLAGHADITTTMGYAHLSPDSLSAAMDRVFGVTGSMAR